MLFWKISCYIVYLSFYFYFTSYYLCQEGYVFGSVGVTSDCLSVSNVTPKNYKRILIIACAPNVARVIGVQTDRQILPFTG